MRLLTWPKCFTWKEMMVCGPLPITNSSYPEPIPRASGTVVLNYGTLFRIMLDVLKTLDNSKPTTQDLMNTKQLIMWSLFSVIEWYSPLEIIICVCDCSNVSCLHVHAGELVSLVSPWGLLTASAHYAVQLVCVYVWAWILEVYVLTGKGPCLFGVLEPPLPTESQFGTYTNRLVLILINNVKSKQSIMLSNVHNID